MVTKTLLETVFPPIITENFDIEKIRVDAKLEQIHVDLVEKKTIPIEFSNRHVISHGYTESRKIQDFPIRGNAVFLYVKRRKWLDVDTGEILTRRYDIAFEGTGLTKEFVAFLKVPSPSIGNEIKRTHTPFTPYLCFGEHKSRNAYGA